MKKILVVLLTLALCVTMLASCNFINKPAETTTEPEETTPVVEYNVDAAADYVYNLYKNKVTTATDFEVTAKVNIVGAIHTVEWSVDTDKVTIEKKDDNTFIVNVDEESPEELAYVLTATISGGGKTATKSFNLTVPKYALTSFEEYIDMTEGDVVVKGIVVGINSKAAGNTRNHLFLADLNGKGGYYSYQMDADPVADLGIEVGMIVEVSGPVSPYSGMQEIKGGVARIVDSTIHTFETVDITEIFANGGSLKNYVGLLVTVKGVEITGQELGGTSEYLKFKLNEKEAYVRTYVTDFPTSLKADDKATIDAAHLEHFGWTANATGILVLYNSNPYLIPVSVDCFEYLELIVKSDAEKIADVLDLVKIGTSFSSDAVVDLPVSAYPEVILTWASNNEAVVFADGKMTVTVPDAATEVIVTVTATCGEVTETKTFTLKLSKTPSSVKEIIDLALSMDHNVYTEGKHLVAGVITEVYNTTYGNMKITDEFGNILTIYGTYSADGANRYDAMENAPVAGDYVVIYGIVGQYNGTPQIKNGWIMSVTTSTSVKDAIDTGAAMEHNTYTADKIIVSGVITEVYNTQYGNMKITDADGNILTIYGTYSATGADRYDKMAVQPVAGDTVVIYGILGQYNGTPQVKNGWIVKIVKGAEAPECTEHVDADGDKKCDVCGADVPAETPDTPVTPEVPATLAEQIAEAQKLANGAYLPYETTMTGTVVGAIQESSYTPGTWKLTLTDGTNTVLLYFVPVTGTPAEGCTITVTGKLTAYNGSAQFDKTATAKVENTTPENPPVEDEELKLDLWMSNPDLFTVNGLNIKYSGAGNTYACVGANVADLAKGNNTFTVTVTNNGAADARVRFDLQCSVQVGNHKVCNVSAVGGDVWTDAEWGGSVVTVPAGQSVTLVITYDENTERGAVVDLVIFVDGARGDANVYNADVTLSGMAFSKVENETPETPETPDEPATENTVNVTIADYAKNNGWANSQAYSSLNLTAEITVSATGTAVGSYGLNTGKYYTNGNNWRIYQSETPALTFTAASGVTIVSVKITYEAQNTGTLTLNGEAVASGTVVTVNAATITFSVGNTGTATNGQARITAIEVVYAGGSAPETPDTPVVPDEPEVPENNDPAADSTLTVEEVIALGASKEHNVYTTGKYYVTGVITEVYNTTYGNMKITDDKGNILTIYGTYSADGSTRYDKMEVQPVVGDTVTVYGIVGQYNGTPQVKNGWIVAHTAATPETPDEPEVPETPDEPVTPDEPAAPSDSITASKTVADLITELGWTSSTTKQEFQLDDKVSVKINGGNNTGKAYNGDHIRIYATDTPAGTITISVPDGYEIVSIKISAVTGTYAFLCVDGTDADICNTVVSVSGSSVVLNSVRNGDSGKQVRVTAIEVIYKAIG